MPRDPRRGGEDGRAGHDSQAGAACGALDSSHAWGRKISAGFSQGHRQDPRRHHRACASGRGMGSRGRGPVKALLDTHILLWWFDSISRLSPQQEEILRGATEEEPLWVSDISLWEIATLSSLRRIELSLPLREWLEQATAPPLVQRLPITPAVAAEVAALPDSFHRDPADRIIVASARVLGATLLTRDSRIIESAVVPTVE